MSIDYVLVDNVMITPSFIYFMNLSIGAEFQKTGIVSEVSLSLIAA